MNYRSPFSIINNTKVWNFYSTTEIDSYLSEIENHDKIMIVSNNVVFKEIEFQYDSVGVYTGYILKDILLLDDGRWEPAFEKKTAFNKDFGITEDTVAEGDHQHTVLTDQEAADKWQLLNTLEFSDKASFLSIRDELLEMYEGDLSGIIVNFPTESDLSFLFNNTNIEFMPDIKAPNATTIESICDTTPFLKLIHPNFFKDKPLLENYTNAFKNDNGIVIKIFPDENGDLPWETGRTTRHSNCFTNCINIPDFYKIPSDWRNIITRDIVIHGYDNQTQTITLSDTNNFIIDFSLITLTKPNASIQNLNTREDYNGTIITDKSQVPNGIQKLYIKWTDTLGMNVSDKN